MFPIFEATVEHRRYEARLACLNRQAELSLDLGEGIAFQPETEESVEDQVIETLWAEGKTPDSVEAGELAEVRASFAVLAPRREAAGHSLVATLMLGFPDSVREERLATLQGFPDQLQLELSEGTLVPPVVDRGTASPTDRLPSVLALRYLIPHGRQIAALISNHAEVPGRWPAPAPWTAWAL